MRRLLAVLFCLPGLLSVPALADEPNLFEEPLEYLSFTQRKALVEAGFERVEASGDAGDVLFVAGSGGPPIVFVHGAGGQAGSWSGVAQGFTAEHPVLLPDLAGHGDSLPADGPLAFDLIVSRFERLMEERVAGEAILVGNSMGAWVASLYAARHPERVARLVLVNGGPLRHVPDDLTLMPADRDAARSLMVALRDPSSPPILDFVLDDVVRQAAAGPIGRMFEASGALEAGVLSEAQVREIRVPTEIVWGASDRYMGRDYAERLDALLPRSRITWLDGCGHIPASECPERLTEVLTRLLTGPPPEAAP